MSRDTSRVLARYFSEVAAAPVLGDPDVEFGLILRWKQHRDQQALKILTEGHLRFVIAKAREYATSERQLEEYIAAGNVGLLEGISRYDVNRKPRMRLLTYAEWWIRKSILETFYREPVAHVPTHVIKEQRRKARENPEYTSLPGCGENALSLDALAAHTLDDDHAKEHAHPDSGPLASRLRREISLLDPRQQTVLSLAFGFKGDPKTDPQIGRILGVSHERARQLRVDAIAALNRRLCKDDDEGDARSDESFA